MNRLLFRSYRHFPEWGFRSNRGQPRSVRLVVRNTVIACLAFFFISRLGLATAQVDVSSDAVTPASHAAHTGHDWPRFLGPNIDGKSSEQGVWLDWPAQGPPILWSRKLGESYGIGTVAGDHYFQADYQDERAAVVCLDRLTGAEVWRYSYPSEYVDLYNYSSGPRTSPVVDDDIGGARVYFYGVEGHLACLDASNGDLLWNVDTAEKFGVIQNFFGVGSTPVIYNDLLIVMVGGSPSEDLALGPGQLDRISGNGSGIVAFDKRTGAVRYQLSNELASYASLNVVQRPERDWCFALMRGGLLVFDPRTGSQDFHFPWRARILESVNASNPVVWDDYVFISETYGPGAALLRYRPDDFQVVWSDLKQARNKSMQMHWNTSIYHDGFLYGCSGRHTNNAELRCIEAMTGKVRWREPGLTRSSLLYVDGHFVCLSEDGVVRLLRANPARYELVREFVPLDAQAARLLNYPAWAAPILSRKLLYVRGSNRLVCFDLRKPVRSEPAGR